MVRTIEIKTCNDCPMMNYSYDDFSMGDYETFKCIPLQKEWSETLTKTGKVPTSDYFIKFYKNGNIRSKNKKTLDNCPLLKEDINITIQK